MKLVFNESEYLEDDRSMIYMQDNQFCAGNRCETIVVRRDSCDYDPHYTPTAITTWEGIVSLYAVKI